MSGDSFGSPRRDDRQSSFFPAPDAAVPDVRVAGPRPGAPDTAARSGDTAGLPAVGSAALHGAPPGPGFDGPGLDERGFDQAVLGGAVVGGPGGQPVVGQPEQPGFEQPGGEQAGFGQGAADEIEIGGPRRRSPSGPSRTELGRARRSRAKAARPRAASGEPGSGTGHNTGHSTGHNTGRRTGLAVAAVVGGAVLAVGCGSVAAFALTGDGGKGGDSGTVASAPVADAAVPEVDTTALAAARRKEAVKRAAESSTLGAPTLRSKGEPIPTETPKPKSDGDGGGGTGGGAGADPVPAGEAQQIAKGMLPSFGFDGDGQFACLVNLWNRESGWRTTAANPSGAYGIPQALPGSKMASAGSDWRTSARTQIKWGLGYIKGRYGTPCGAWSFFQSHNSY
ncbi:hypothetical protein [Actinomadura atramentaria]|uniref:aggregation-promoting factor C-terminal-like domain-containing protein n=1 Tax=Actinomadura atramentaria TaxID=1990 RepID=UPI00037CBAD8|nr:hypothetical protein [Actinomadura atramentaria]